MENPGLISRRFANHIINYIGETMLILFCRLLLFIYIRDGKPFLSKWIDMDETLSEKKAAA